MLSLRKITNYDTQNYLNICKEFVDQVYAPVNDVPRESQIDMKNHTIDYFKTKETFSEDQFKNEVLENDDVKRHLTVQTKLSTRKWCQSK